MTIKEQQEIEQRVARFESVCRKNGVKLTQQRIEIFLEVARAGDHPDAEQVFQRVKERLPTVSLDTVYRTLWMLNDLGLIVTLGASREATRFDANLDHHHHFVCERCGMTKDFYSDGLSNLELPDSLDQLGEIIDTQVEVRGICNACIKKKGTKKP